MSLNTTPKCIYFHPIGANGLCDHRHPVYDHDNDPYRDFSKELKRYIVRHEAQGYKLNPSKRRMEHPNGSHAYLRIHGKDKKTWDHLHGEAEPALPSANVAPDARFQGLANARAKDKATKKVHVVEYDPAANFDDPTSGIFSKWKNDGFHVSTKSKGSSGGGAAKASLVWTDPKTGSKVYICGQYDVTPKMLKEHSINLAISVTEVPQSWKQAVKGADIEWLEAPIADAGVWAQKDHHKDNAREALMTLGRAIKEGKNVSVNCFAGMHRSTATVYSTLYLLGYFPTLKAAFDHVHMGRKQAEWRDGIPQWMVGIIKPGDPQSKTEEKPNKQEGGYMVKNKGQRAAGTSLCSDCRDCKKDGKVYPTRDGIGCDGCGHTVEHTHRAYEAPKAPATPATTTVTKVEGEAGNNFAEVEAELSEPAAHVSSGEGWLGPIPMLEELAKLGVVERRSEKVGTVGTAYRYRLRPEWLAAQQNADDNTGYF